MSRQQFPSGHSPEGHMNLFYEWSNLVGPVYGDQTTPNRLDRATGELLVVASSTNWAVQTRLASPWLIEQIKRLSNSTVRAMTVITKP